MTLPNIPYNFLLEHSVSMELDCLSVLQIDERLPLDSKSLEAWQSAGFAGELSYMLRPPELLANPGHLLENGQTIVSFRIPYETPPTAPRLPGHGRVARYALGRDYHRAIRSRLTKLMAGLLQMFPSLEYRIFTDAVPLLERAVAREAGLGFQGKNTMLIRKGEGSFFFIAEVITNAQIIDMPPQTTDTSSCKTCTRCITACPTNALVDEYVLDARLCISYLTIEKRGPLALWEQEALGEWIFGCDVCQEVCPFNHKKLTVSGKTALNNTPVWPDFSPRFTPAGLLAFDNILAIKTDEQFLATFAGMPIMRTKREGLIRNCAAVIANQKEYEFCDALIELGFDDSYVVRHACLSAIMRLCKSFAGEVPHLLRLLEIKVMEMIRRDENKFVRGILE